MSANNLIIKYFLVKIHHQSPAWRSLDFIRYSIAYSDFPICTERIIILHCMVIFYLRVLMELSCGRICRS